jgi:uncharacterized protein
MTYICVLPEERRFEWNAAKSDWNRVERGLAFELAIMLIDRPTLERPDARTDHREERMQAIGMIGGMVLACVYTDRGVVRRMISLRPANRRERDVYRAAFQD